jgi:hypothetical protein
VPEPLADALDGAITGNIVLAKSYIIRQTLEAPLVQNCHRRSNVTYTTTPPLVPTHFIDHIIDNRAYYSIVLQSHHVGPKEVYLREGFLRRTSSANSVSGWLQTIMHGKWEMDLRICIRKHAKKTSKHVEALQKSCDFQLKVIPTDAPDAANTTKTDAVAQHHIHWPVAICKIRKQRGRLSSNTTCFLPPCLAKQFDEAAGYRLCTSIPGDSSTTTATRFCIVRSIFIEYIYRTTWFARNLIHTKLYVVLNSEEPRNLSFLSSLHSAMGCLVAVRRATNRRGHFRHFNRVIIKRPSSSSAF